jgi:ParB family chromosome partitioning protein
VRGGVCDEAAARISGLKKPDMANQAETLLAGTGWLPALLRRPQPARAKPSENAPAVLAAE